MSEQVKSQGKKPPRRYGISFYDSLNDARNDLENLTQKSHEVDQLNIIIRAEGAFEDAELSKIGKLFSGKAWVAIHEKRVEEGWYNSAH